MRPIREYIRGEGTRPNMDVRYNSDGLAASKWGPGVWQWLHALPEHANSVDRLRKCLGSLCLPCPECQAHYDDFLKRRPIGVEVRTRGDAFQWILDLHNEVNTRTGKPVYTKEKCFVEHCLANKRNEETRGQETIGLIFG